MKRKLLLITLSLVLIMASLAGCGAKETSGGDDGDVIKIGVFEPMTGV
ncbi:MAG: branched-chain amino acid ABC transporter substrate-binding protein, partial [Tissierellia bacterium]|nr:branched-chain amino acid ABC transporter substrate-binding protein [Tissierellia bacterium]